MITEDDFNNPLKVYKLNEEESAQATLFTPLQLAYLYNKRANVISTKLTLTVEDPKNIFTFVQKEAELQGMMHILNELISESILNSPKE
jgi:cell fate (sporulation/competence/biofilm development) regulator YlbF (YheA/YmcA/DUF963 family)